ncbi:GAF domain-containing protein [Sulfobacillus sp. hq2]|uniref:GAF domain-containing protein n=1 Tax=Sulfobacillus TaxID=28033 RepID=UPI000CD1733C|nr:GAF domain-containing protein [Sulfobacillus sp. hq2]POB10852.1 hypothetical protein CO251_08565 [Sulfobacillus sp. hq2]
MNATAAYQEALAQLDQWREVPEADDVAIMANLVAILKSLWPHCTWIGFYRAPFAGQDLVLGPFWGDPAPLVVPWGSGVIGSCAQERAVQIVGAVSRFAGYIPAVSRTQSEVAWPIIRGTHLYAVLDCQAAEENGFDLADIEWMGKFADRLS